MNRPSLLLAVLGVGHLAVGHLTLQYPASYLTMPFVWAVLAMVAGALAIAAMFDGRTMMVASGAALVAHATARCAAITAELLTAQQPTDAARASFIIAAITWAMVAVMLLELWRRLLIPWGASRGRR